MFSLSPSPSLPLSVEYISLVRCYINSFTCQFMWLLYTPEPLNMSVLIVRRIIP